MQNITKMSLFKEDLIAAMQSGKIRKAELKQKYGISDVSLSYFLRGVRKGLSGEAVLRLLDFVYEPLVLKRQSKEKAEKDQPNPEQKEKECNE